MNTEYVIRHVFLVHRLGASPRSETGQYWRRIEYHPKPAHSNSTIFTPLHLICLILSSPITSRKKISYRLHFGEMIAIAPSQSCSPQNDYSEIVLFDQYSRKYASYATFRPCGHVLGRMTPLRAEGRISDIWYTPVSI